MSITVELSPNTELRIQEQASLEQKPVEQIVSRLLEQAVAEESPYASFVDREIDPLEYTRSEWLIYFDNATEHFRRLRMPTLPPEADSPDTFYEDEAL